MSEVINFADLTDFSGNNIIAPKNGIYGIVLRKTGPVSKSVYKFNIDLLETYFLSEDELDIIKRRTINLRTSLENLVQTFETIDYLKEHDYMQKYIADSYRSLLATEETVKAMTTDYLTKDRLQAQVEEAERHAYECAASYITSMSHTAATAQGANANTNTAVSKFDELTEAIAALDTSEKDEDDLEP